MAADTPSLRTFSAEQHLDKLWLVFIEERGADLPSVHALIKEHGLSSLYEEIFHFNFFERQITNLNRYV
ncbi:hypothetical protein QW060_20530 [Myroides ceti]|uniref:Uncharacterized protein n=1 Tax=Paenimyroides ceti TaxID=395087 RepID=A0ABT8CY44_9FLAO|nr:hypothetical protein [Paenimyroides ceti]MDN3706720.1 hypothetical protein [Paenimyroides ceti]MDN3709399.1 hypothetical protein [Paenimyroides ceti]